MGRRRKTRVTTERLGIWLPKWAYNLLSERFYIAKNLDEHHLDKLKQIAEKWGWNSPRTENMGYLFYLCYRINYIDPSNLERITKIPEKVEKGKHKRIHPNLSIGVKKEIMKIREKYGKKNFNSLILNTLFLVAQRPDTILEMLQRSTDEDDNEEWVNQKIAINPKIENILKQINIKGVPKEETLQYIFDNTDVNTELKEKDQEIVRKLEEVGGIGIKNVRLKSATVAQVTNQFKKGGAEWTQVIAKKLTLAAKQNIINVNLLKLVNVTFEIQTPLKTEETDTEKLIPYPLFEKKTDPETDIEEALKIGLQNSIPVETLAHLAASPERRELLKAFAKMKKYIEEATIEGEEARELLLKFFPFLND
jgi:hypothetical protein